MTGTQTAAAMHATGEAHASTTLVVPLDGSSESLAALPVARALAECEGDTVHILHVCDGRLTTRELVGRLNLTDDQISGTVLTARDGEPAAEIVKQARGLGASLIVMSARTVGEPVRGALGSVTREVLRQAPCPIVIVPPDRPRVPWALRQILLPHDGIPTTAAAIARTADLARQARAEMAVLHVASPTTPPPGEAGALMAPRYLDQPQHEWPNWAREFMDRVVALGGPPPGVRMRLFFASGEPADVIVDFVAQHHSDLVVIAWVPGWEPEQRTTMRKVIDQAPGPLLIFPLEQPQRGMVF